jgi:hypothetical protein
MKIQKGEKVRIHKNLNKGCFSIIPMEKGNPLKGKVIHIESASLSNCEFRVQPKSLDTVREKGVRSVVAYITGIYEGEANKLSKEFCFNPFKEKFFCDKDSRKRIDHCERISLTADDNYYYA